MTNPELIINPELRDLLPPLDAEELAGLEESILQDGCTDKLIVWGSILVDGHHRYAICTKHNIPFKIKQRDFKSIEEVKLWMWKHQESRRNLTIFQRAEIALKMKEVLVVQAKERQRGGQGGILLVQNSGQANGKTDHELARRSGLSHDTIRKAEFLLDHADAETKARLRSTKKETSINKEFTRLKAELNATQPAKSKNTKASTTAKTATKKASEQTDTSAQATFSEAADDPATHTSHQATDAHETESKATTDPGDTALETITVTLKSRPKVNERYCCGVKFEPDPDDNVFDWITEVERAELNERRKNCPNRVVPYIHNFTIQNVPEHKPDQLINCLFSLFRPLYREKLAFALLRTMADTETDRENAKKIVTTLFHEFQNR